jgi:hypothetical protein
MKYIICKAGELEVPVIFGDRITHAQMARQMPNILFGYEHVVGAGRIVLGEDTHIFDTSISLEGVPNRGSLDVKAIDDANR